MIDEEQAEMEMSSELARDIADKIEELQIPAEFREAVPVALVTLAGRMIGSSIKNAEFVKLLTEEYTAHLAEVIVSTYRAKSQYN